MRLKSYFSGTVEAAMELARQELGEEALLVNARPATPETRYLGAYEVVFGIPPRAAQIAAAPASSAAAGTGNAERAEGDRQSDRLLQNDRPGQNDRLAQEVASLKREFERMIRALAETQSSSSSLAGASGQDADPKNALASYEVDATLGRPGAARAIVTLVGPPGVGKTTTLIKLAARYGLTAKKPTRILSADVYRIAAADQLRSLASILGIGCDVAETAGALAQMFEEHRSKDLLFVDTPGLARADMEDLPELAALIASHEEVDTHLVLPASMRASDMERVIGQYAIFGPRKLLFTRVDETDSHAEMIAVAARHKLPISFLATGQQIPDDLEPAERAAIDALLGMRSRSVQSITKGAAA